jgi:hypothetical protein
MLAINAIATHEIGCPNSKKTWSIEENEWIEAEQEVESE